MKAAVPPEEFEVGQTIGWLTITSLKPFTQQCVCGKTCKRTRVDIRRNGVRSCGCKSRNRHGVQPNWRIGQRCGIYEIIGKISTGRRWLVRCTACLNEKTVTEGVLYYVPRFRCQECP